MRCPGVEAWSGEVTDNAFLGGALHVLQPKAGYRAGIDAVLLAAAAPLRPGRSELVLDCGAGVGTVGLCVAVRVAGARVALLEREARLTEIARENIRRNRLEGSVRAIDGRVGAAATELEGLGLAPESFDHVLANPPFHGEGEGTAAPDRLKAGAHVMPGDGLEHWGRFLARMSKPAGTATVVHKAEALAELLQALGDRFGALRVLPLHSRAGEPAIRIIVQGIKGSRAPLALLPGLILHGEDGSFTPPAEAILRHGSDLSLLGPR